MRAPAFETAPPRFDTPLDLSAHLALLPAGATAKGMFHRDLVVQARTARPAVDLFAVANVAPRRHLPFFDYPYSELLRLLTAAARTIWPNEPLGEGVRRLGRSAYGALIGSQVGKVLFAALGSDFGRVASVGVRGWKVAVSFGIVDYVRVSEHHAAYHFEDFPGFLETYQVGVIEGAMQICGVRGEVWSRVDSLSKGTLEVFWE